MTEPKLVNSSVSRFVPSTAWREVIVPGEEQLFDDFADRVIVAKQKEVAAQGDGTVLRGFHAKLHAGLVGEFQVLDDLPEYARFGIFKEPCVFAAVIRFSNGMASREGDKGPDTRGIAIKLIGVPGDKLPPSNKDDVTQDFLATSRSTISTVRNAGQFLAFIEASRKGWLLPFYLARAVGVYESLRIVVALLRSVVIGKVRSVATEHYSSTAPIKFGPYAVKFTVRPAEGTEPPARRQRTANFLREELTDRLRKGDLLYDFVVQFYVDERRTPIEDSSVTWKPKHTPFVRVAQLRIPSCDLNDPVIKARSDVIDQYLFFPWHSIEEHRPLGNTNRSRLATYQASASLRGHSPEPTSLPR